MAPVPGLTNSTLFSFKNLLIIRGSDHLINILAVTLWALLLTRFFLCITVSPTLSWWDLPPSLNRRDPLRLADIKFLKASAQSDWLAADLSSTSNEGKSHREQMGDNFPSQKQQVGRSLGASMEGCVKSES